MSWGIIAVAGTAAASAYGAYSQAGAKNLLSIGASTEGFISDAETWSRNEGDNKAIQEANLQNQIRTGFKVGLLNVQKAQNKKALLAQGISISHARQEALGAATANAAAAGTIGSSVDAVTADIENKIGEANSQLDADYDQVSQNFDIQLQDLLMSGKDALKSAVNITVRDRKKAETSNGVEEAIVAGAVSAGSMYASSKMSLGLGSPSGTASTGASLGSGVSATGGGTGFQSKGFSLGGS